MNDPAAQDGVWFVYDGACPLCNAAAHAFRIRQKYGTLHLINARESADEPLMHEIANRGLDLDEGMVIYCQGEFYHGKDALRFMAQAGNNEGMLNYFSKAVFRSDRRAAFIYPWLRGARNILLKIRKVGKIGKPLRDDGDYTLG